MKHCGLQYCPSCEKEVNILRHKCYLQPVTHEQKKKKNKQRTIFVYFDIEAQQDTGNHVANLVCAETDQNDKQFTFEGKDCVPDFIQWVHSLANQEDVEKVIVVAHNFKGYDGYFILDELYKQHTTNLNQIVNGAKILSLELPNIKFIDSMNFFPMALSNFPKTFGLNEMKKGFFPHFFNTQQNQIYEGYMPEKSYYDPDGMSPQRKEEFDKWYNEKVSERYIFNFQHELLTYCQSDVRLLKQGCIKFQSQFHDICGFNPMVHCITIASACNTAYRKNWMPKNQIAIEPVRGWRPNHTQSHAALKWLYWEESKLHKTNHLPRIAHARNKGEKKKRKWLQNLPGRRLRRTNTYRLRVSGLFSPRLCRLLPKPYHETSHSTSYARLRLYDALDTLKERVLYFDADSVIYTKKPAESSIPTGNYLGEFTNELDEGDHITEFVAAGPKNYAYETFKENQCCKVRGFTLNARGQKILNFNSMKNLVLDEILNEEEEQQQQPRTLTLHNPHKITRCAATKTIKTVSQNKMYKLVFDKRVIDHDTFRSFPYGYKCGL